MRRALLLLALLPACGLDDFDWGGAKNEICAVEWEMKVSGPEGAEDVRPDVRDVHVTGPGDVSWEAHYSEVTQRLRIRNFRFDEQPVYLLVRDRQIFAVRVSGPCTRSLADSSLREAQLRRYVCELVGEHEAITLHGQLVLEEVDRCR